MEGTWDVVLGADVVVDAFDFFCELDGAFGAIDELLNGLLVDVVLEFAFDIDCKSGDLFIEQVAFPSDLLEQFHHFFLAELLHVLLADHILNEEG